MTARLAALRRAIRLLILLVVECRVLAFAGVRVATGR
jgi:hypothetical protein